MPNFVCSGAVCLVLISEHILASALSIEWAV